MSYRENASRAISHLHGKSNRYAESHSGKNRGIAAGAAATFLELGYDRVNRDKRKEMNKEVPKDFDPYDELLDDFSPDTPKDDSKSSSFEAGKTHFVDSFLERFIKNTIPDDSPDKQTLESRLKDPAKKNKPGLSIRVISHNFKTLASRMGVFFELQYGIVHVVTWKKPSKTLSMLVLYTAVCLWPHLVVAFPMIFLLFGIIVPGYLHRHPMRTPEFIPVKRRGQSFLSFFSDENEHSIVEDLLEHNNMMTDDNDLRPVSSTSDTASTVSDIDEPSGEKIEKDKARHVKSRMALLINMRDLQNLTTDLLKGFDQAEKFWFETAGFKDERLSTFIFYGVILSTWVILFLGQFIPWRLIFIQSGWVGMIVCHPGFKKYLVEMSKKKKEREVLKPEPEKEPESEVKKFERNDIIVDETPEVRVVEVFELQKKNVLETDTQWAFYRYTTSIFDIKNTTRLAHKEPKGVDSLSKVLPVKDWKFDLGFANKWKIDRNPRDLIKARSLSSAALEVHDDEKEGWIYDVVESFDDDFAVEFRRRRLYRECYQYARPVRTFKKL